MRVRVCGVIALSLRLRSRAPAQARVQVREQHLAAGDRVRVHAAADLHVQPQRPVALDALQVDVVEVVEHADVAGLADVLDQLLEDGPDRSRLIERAQRRERQPGEAGTCRVALAGGVAQHHARALELHEQAMHGLPRQSEPGRKIGEADRLRMPENGLQHRQRSLNGGCAMFLWHPGQVCCVAGRKGGLRRCSGRLRAARRRSTSTLN